MSSLHDDTRSSSDSSTTSSTRCRSICHSIGRFFTSPLFASFCYFIVGLYANAMLQLVADRQVVHCNRDDGTPCPPSPDLGHEVFPYLHIVPICDYWLYTCIGLTIIRFSPIFVSKSMSLVLLRRWLFLQGTMFWMRGISVALTRQSVPQEDCVATANGEPWIEGFYIIFGVHVTCGDIMFSGHTAGITLVALIWTHYSKGEEFSVCCGEHRPFITPNLDAVGDPATCSLTSIVVWILACGGFFFIIATHFHYSNDVFIGLMLTQFVFRVYHYYIKNVLEQPGLWARLFRWFEGFDKSLEQTLPVTASKDRDGRNINSPNNGNVLKPDAHTYGYNRDGQSLSAYESAAAHANLDKNEHQAIKPLAGVGVAVFSEGPKKEERDMRDREDSYGKNGMIGSALAGGKEKDGKYEHDTRININDNIHTDHISPTNHDDYHYHAMEGGMIDHAFRNSVSQQRVPQRDEEERKTQDSQPIVVAGEIAQQEADKERTGKK